MACLAELVDLGLELGLGLPGAALLLRQLLLQLRDDVLLRLVRREQLRRLQQNNKTVVSDMNTEILSYTDTSLAMTAVMGIILSYVRNVVLCINYVC